MLQSTYGSRIFSVIDLKEAFYSIEIEESDKKKTAFEIKGKVFEFNSMVMGFKNSPQILTRIMSKVFDGMIGKGVEVYMDDIIIYAKSEKEHDKILLEALNRIFENNFQPNLEKIQIGQEEIKILGVSINKTEMKPLENQKDLILNAENPKKITELRRWLGKINWFRIFIPRLATKLCALTDSLKVKSEGN